MSASLDHVACVYHSAETAHSVLGECLGLRHLRSFTVSPDVAYALFDVSDELEVLVFGGEARVVEAMILPSVPPCRSPAHACLLVDSLERTLARCREGGLMVRSATVGDHAVYFVVDPDGNLFELKQRSR